MLLESIEWEKDVSVLFGKRIETKRMVAWYGDKAFEYEYSNHKKVALNWTPELLELKKILKEEIVDML